MWLMMRFACDFPAFPWRTACAGKFLPAVTYYRVRHTTPAGLTWVELEPVTGRRHQ